MASHGSEVIDLNSGYLHPSIQPLDSLAGALGRVGRRTESWQRPPATGLGQLREWFAAEIGADLGREDILICGGGQSALATVMRALATPGDQVLVESPTYPGIAAAARSAGLAPLEIPLDDQGIRPDQLALV